MGASCCENKSTELIQLRTKQAKILQVVMAINLAMFFIEFSMGLWAQSTALMGDSLDMLGDAIVYGFSLYVLHRSERTRATAALMKGMLILAFGIWVLFAAAARMFTNSLPVAEAMGVFGFVALLANAWCLILLVKHKDDDLNMKSTYLCSRNDIISNVGVMVAALLVSIFNSKWPDILVGFVISILFIRSALPILKESLTALLAPAPKGTVSRNRTPLVREP